MTDEELLREERDWRAIANENVPLDDKRCAQDYYLCLWLEMQRRGLPNGEN